MVTLPFFVSLFIFIFLPCTISTLVCDSYEICSPLSPYIQFPFWLRDKNSGKRCGYPGFELSCDNGRTLLNIPNGGNFVVTKMSSVDAFIDDTDGCFPRRFLEQNVSLTGTPFKWGDDYPLLNFTFLKCSDLLDWYPLEHVPCLSSSYRTDVVVLFPDKNYEKEWISSCQLISSAWIPMSYSSPWSFSWDHYSEIKLKWDKPDCSNCDPDYEQCGFSGDIGTNVTCYPRYTSPSNAAKNAEDTSLKDLGIALAVLLIFSMVVRCFLSARSDFRRRRQQLRAIAQASLELPTLIALQPPVVAVTAVGLDRSIIETYPKIEVTESGALPDPNDNVCSICLSEYQPRETLRNIPYCNHYFHLNCLDEWLNVNATCPLCRNLLPGNSLSMF
ncbi:hypothetical protein L6164_037088 [Bauhinia variegata]|uniref:Uncharacterized protein n=1 Tax=Bauhinia variegata TaxID=167791 RepID=A0ACB9KJ36_BAUVA|nr:hypothetical protein L6164_037088 [Bauhinia variegata]